ncbi:hypothetical protein H7I41_28520 [Mycobacterium manitobense]|uniref:Uncharacterized protein n=1 Tax=[Mycobacterium] manitobense TaxID=190147 RepID=A0A9X2YG59_9MYCO|nr:hypothetical protein [[Mycobacterium] manitobense]MCV7173872.1 hypothetical protein [[Mycobacterium] manitobense]
MTSELAVLAYPHAMGVSLRSKTLGGCFAAIVLGLCASGCDAEGDQREDARERCLRYVADRLVSPSSAEFGDVTVWQVELSDADITHMKSQFPKFKPSGVTAVYSIVGKVDSQNTYAAMIRSSFECRAIYQEDFSDAVVNVW